MNTSRPLPCMSAARQAGFTLIELLVAAIVSIIAVSGMLILMASTLGSGTQTIELTRMTQEMRTGMQIMARELRRANYHGGFLQCFGNPTCLNSINIGGTPTNITGWVDDINITDNGTSDCFWFWYDRPQACNSVGGCSQATMLALQGPVTGEYVAAFRRDTTADGVGTVQMTTTTTTAPNCAVDTGWTDITDPNVVDVLSLDVSNANSICETFASGNTQLVEQIQITMTARPVFDASVDTWLQGLFTAPGGGGDSAIREMVEFINVRNNVIRAACP